METKLGFTLMSVDEFEQWIKTRQVARTILTLQQHHTFSPSYGNFKGDNHFAMQSGMKSYHVHNNGWSDIGQHFSIFPDGKIMTGRNLEWSPACIKGRNDNALCIENIGNFDDGKDVMSTAQRNSIVRASAAIAKRFAIPVSSDRIVYHHWFDLNTGSRTNGNSGSVKSCPGTNFFGGNKVKNCEDNFLPLVRDALKGEFGNPMAGILKFGYVTSDTLNIRKGPGSNHEKVNETWYGSILRIYKEENGWYKISRFQDEWVSGNFVQDVRRARVSNTDRLNVRSGPGTNFTVVGAYRSNEELFVFETSGTWAKIGLDDRWVSSKFLTML